jgi:hypothetical protein
VAGGRYLGNFWWLLFMGEIHQEEREVWVGSLLRLGFGGYHLSYTNDTEVQCHQLVWVSSTAVYPGSFLNTAFSGFSEVA